MSSANGSIDLAISFNRRLAEAMDSSGSLVCVGLDPRPDRTQEPYEDFCRRIIDATWQSAAAFKPNSAYFEARGPEGLAALATVIAHKPDDRIMVLDAKRGDISFSAECYAEAAFRRMGADALTISPYLGGDSIAPFLENPATGAFLLCHTSNPGAGDLQQLMIEGRPLYQHVAALAADWNGKDNLGLVVGATYPEALGAVRDLAPELPFLVPGIGAQGGDLEASLSAGLDAHGRGLLISSSRGIIYADQPGEAAARLTDAINSARARA